MLQNQPKALSKIIFVSIAVLGFALIRNFEDALFYDPFLNFFKGAYTSKAIPEVLEWKLYLSLFIRYFLNTVLSLFVIYALFKNKEFLNLALFLYVVFFSILLLLLIGTIHFFSEKLMLLFYIRRFLIQPIFLLLFIPGFYFQKYHFQKQNL